MDSSFVDPEKREFRFASDEVIKQTGFQPFDYSRTGVYGDAAWIALAKEWTYAPVGTPPVLR